MENSKLATLPSELLEAVVALLPPSDTLAFGLACKQINVVTRDPLVWQRRCLQIWKHWSDKFPIGPRLPQPTARINWLKIFGVRSRIDGEARRIFNEMLLQQQGRVVSLDVIAHSGEDVKDLLLDLRDQTPDDAEDVLARRYHANVLLERIERDCILKTWSRIAKKEPVPTDEALASFDAFVLPVGRKSKVMEIRAEFDDLANTIRAATQDFDYLSTRQKALNIAHALRSQGRIVTCTLESYHDLRHNFISMALFQTPHTALPLQSAAIYCEVASRLGVDACLVDYPHHVYAFVRATSGFTLDGAPIDPEQPPAHESTQSMFMDPWVNAEEVPRAQLHLRLTQMGCPPEKQGMYLKPSSVHSASARTCWNLYNSVRKARGLDDEPDAIPDIEKAWYAALWSMLILGIRTSIDKVYERRQCLLHLLDHFKNHFQEDLTLIERELLPMCASESERDILEDLVANERSMDAADRVPVRRSVPDPLNSQNRVAPAVTHRVGTYLRHRRFRYYGIIVGWDDNCAQDQEWIDHMGVDMLPRGRQQPFYHVIADDRSARYVAEENIVAILEPTEPSDAIMSFAGKWFKRWDAGQMKFESNIKDEYPDD